MNALSVVVLDTDSTQDDYYRKHFGAFFRELGYEIDLDYSFLIRRDITDVLSDFGSSRHANCFIFICDLSLSKGSGATNLGVPFIRRVKQNFPEVFCILASYGDELGRARLADPPRADMYIEKNRFLPGTDPWKSLKVEFEETIRMDLKASLDLSEPLRVAQESEGKIKDITRRELEGLMRQIIYRPLVGDEGIDIDSVDLQLPSAGGRSGSMVFIGTITLRNGARALPAVIKISPRDEASAEYRNFERFVKWHLSHLFRVDVLARGVTRSYGAIAYSFAFAGTQVKPESVSWYIEDGRYGDLANYIIPTVFSTSGRGWYAEEMVQPMTGLATYYYNKFFAFADGDRLSYGPFDSAVDRYFGGQSSNDRNTVEIAGQTYPGRNALTRWAPVEFHTCICHGDFNSSNVMVAATDRKTRGGRVQRVPDRFIFIDFQDTGRGHVFQDFVAFESSVRMNYGRDGSYIYAAKGEEDVANKQLSPQQFLQWECQLARLVAGTELNEGPQLFRLIAQIRSMARRNFPTEDWNTYLYASAIHHFRLLRLGGNDEHQQGRLTAAVIASLNELRVRTGH